VRRNWIAVVSAEHVMRGRDGGFMQVSHGKAAPLGRMRPGDRVAYYSPTQSFRGKDRLQTFTALGLVADGEPYRCVMGGGFRPFRRAVNWLPSRPAPIAPLLDKLEFSAGQRNWGYPLRFGLFEVSNSDFVVIAAAMEASLPT
jgi:hypothetical protein